MTTAQIQLIGRLSDYSRWFRDAVTEIEEYEFPEPTAVELADKIERMYGHVLEFRTELDDARREDEECDHE
jgi:hypothetical protein